MTIRTKLAGLVIATSAISLITSCKPKPGGDTPPETTKPAASANATLRFSAIPDQNVTEQSEKYQPLADYLSKALDTKVEFVPAPDYDSSVSKFVNGEIQLAWFGGLTGVQARNEVEGAVAIAQGKEDPEYFSYFIANASTGLEKSDEFPEAIKDLKFSFGSKGSTSGRLMPTYFIIEKGGQSPEDFFTQPVNYSGAHDKTALLVQDGTWEVGALSYTTYDKMVKEGKLDPEKCRVIWKTPFYADYNFTAHPALEETYGEGFIQKLQDALLAIDDPKILDVMQRTGIIKAENKDFDGIKQVAEKLDLL